MPPLNLRHINSFTLITVIVLSIGCNQKNWKEDKPVFTKSTEAVAKDLTKIIDCEKVKFEGEEANVNNVIFTTLQVEIINASTDLSAEKDLNNIGSIIVDKIKKELINSNQYGDYTIIFTKVSSDWIEKTTTSKYFYY